MTDQTNAAEALEAVADALACGGDPWPRPDEFVSEWAERQAARVMAAIIAAGWLSPEQAEERVRAAVLLYAAHEETRIQEASHVE